MNLEAMLQQAKDERGAEARLWLSEIMSRGLPLDQLEKVFDDLLKSGREVSQQDRLLHDLKVDYLAQKIDYLINPTGERIGSLEEQSADSFIKYLSELELADRLFEQVTSTKKK